MYVVLNTEKKSSCVVCFGVIKKVRRFRKETPQKNLRCPAARIFWNSKDFMKQDEFCTCRRIHVGQKECCVFIPSCTALAHLGYAVTIGPLLWWNGRGSFHSAAPWAGLVFLQHGWTAWQKMSLNWKGSALTGGGTLCSCTVLSLSSMQQYGPAPALERPISLKLETWVSCRSHYVLSLMFLRRFFLCVCSRASPLQLFYLFIFFKRL